MATLPKIVVIVGPTASGKTSLSIALAKQFNGEVVSADSRQVYKGLDLGSGKVTEEEKDGVPHHLLDVAEPNATYTAADFEADAIRAVSDITNCGRLPIIAGGTFFYIDVLLGRNSLPRVAPNTALREQLELKSAHELYEALVEKDPKRAETIDADNKRRLIRALEIVDALGVVPQVIPTQRYDVLTLGIDIPKETLHQNIRTRIEERLKIGMIEEVAELHASGVPYERLESFGLEYRYIAQHLQNKLTRDEMIAKLQLETQHFAKRQLTWLKRDKSIMWFNPTQRTELLEAVTNFLEE